MKHQLRFTHVLFLILFLLHGYLNQLPLFFNGHSDLPSSLIFSSQEEGKSSMTADSLLNITSFGSSHSPASYSFISSQLSASDTEKPGISKLLHLTPLFDYFGSSVRANISLYIIGDTPSMFLENLTIVKTIGTSYNSTNPRTDLFLLSLFSLFNESGISTSWLHVNLIEIRAATVNDSLLFSQLNFALDQNPHFLISLFQFKDASLLDLICQRLVNLNTLLILSEPWTLSITGSSYLEPHWKLLRVSSVSYPSGFYTDRFELASSNIPSTTRHGYPGTDLAVPGELLHLSFTNITGNSSLYFPSSSPFYSLGYLTAGLAFTTSLLSAQQGFDPGKLYTVLLHTLIPLVRSDKTPLPVGFPDFWGCVHAYLNENSIIDTSPSFLTSQFNQVQLSTVNDTIIPIVRSYLGAPTILSLVVRTWAPSHPQNGTTSLTSSFVISKDTTLQFLLPSKVGTYRFKLKLNVTTVGITTLTFSFRFLDQEYHFSSEIHVSVPAHLAAVVSNDLFTYSSQLDLSPFFLYLNQHRIAVSYFNESEALSSSQFMDYLFIFPDIVLSSTFSSFIKPFLSLEVPLLFFPPLQLQERSNWHSTLNTYFSTPMALSLVSSEMSIPLAPSEPDLLDGLPLTTFYLMQLGCNSRGFLAFPSFSSSHREHSFNESFSALSDGVFFNSSFSDRSFISNHSLYDAYPHHSIYSWSYFDMKNRTLLLFFASPWVFSTFLTELFSLSPSFNLWDSLFTLLDLNASLTIEKTEVTYTFKQTLISLTFSSPLNVSPSSYLFWTSENIELKDNGIELLDSSRFRITLELVTSLQQKTQFRIFFKLPHFSFFSVEVTINPSRLQVYFSYLVNFFNEFRYYFYGAFLALGVHLAYAGIKWTFKHKPRVKLRLTPSHAICPNCHLKTFDISTKTCTWCEYQDSASSPSSPSSSPSSSPISLKEEQHLETPSSNE